MRHVWRIWVVIFLLLGFLTSISVEAQEEEFPIDLDSLRDPFLSQLPPPKVVVTPEPVKVKPVERLPVPVVNNAPVNVAPEPVIVRPPAIDTMVIKGVVWNTDIPQAIVNDKVVKVGDEVNGIKIAAIRKDGVEFASEGFSVFLKIAEPRGVSAY